MKMRSKLAAAGLLALGLAGASATAASAAIVCNSEGECWHVRHHHHFHYRPEFGVVVHPDDWRWAPTEHYVWREHEGRGYWRGGRWVVF